jgi:hypothetical protein
MSERLCSAGYGLATPETIPYPASTTLLFIVVMLLNFERLWHIGCMNTIEGFRVLLQDADLEQMTFVTARTAEVGSLAIGVAHIHDADAAEKQWLFDMVVVSEPGVGRYDPAEASYHTERLSNGNIIRVVEPALWRAFLDAIVGSKEFDFGLSDLRMTKEQ